MVENQGSNDQQRSAHRAPRTAPLFEQQPTGGNKQTPNRDYDSWREWVRLFLEILALLYLASYVHWTKVQSVATERAAKAASDSVNAARQSNLIANETMRASERPYVYIGKSKNGVAAEWLTDGKGNKIGLNLYFENQGNTPARRFVLNGHSLEIKTSDTEGRIKPFRPAFHLQFVVVQSQGEIIVGGDPIPKNIVPLMTYGYVQGVAIPSHETGAIPLGNLTPEHIKDALAGRKGFTITGSFEYTDIFNEYCCEPFALTSDSKGLSAQVAGWGLRNIVCPRDVPNICRPNSENHYPKEQ